MDNSQSSPHDRRVSMTEEEERERRSSIQAIYKDPNLTEHERRKSILCLMDGRRRSSHAHRDSSAGAVCPVNSIAAAAAMAAAEFDGSSDDDDDNNDAIPEDEVVSGNNKGRSTGVISRKSSLKSTGEKNFPNKRRSSLSGSFISGFSKMSSDDCVSEKMESSKIDSTALSRKMETIRPPCGHYQRNCSIVSPCCGLVFGCRICHDDSPVLPPPIFIEPFNGVDVTVTNDSASDEGKTNSALSSGDAASFATPGVHERSRSSDSFVEEHHNIDRFSIKEVICRECYTRQSSKANNCINCNVQFGEYHCSICNLWMSADENPYHCEKCGFCRVGGRAHFMHCDDCGMCIDVQLFNNHNCKSGKYLSNCPVCQEDLFSSRMATHEMPCGHAIHWHCFREFSSFDTRCPVCKKTAETQDRMEQTWTAMAIGIALQPVPPEMSRVVDIICNDCEGRGTNQRWHFLGVQCQHCPSFNTTVERTVLVGQEAADYLGPITIDPSYAIAAAAMDQNIMVTLLGQENNGNPSDDFER